jgi:hypothetical protein
VRKGQRHHLDPFVLERSGFFGRCHAADAALGCLVIMDATRFFGEAFADVFGIGGNLARHLHEHRLQLRRRGHRCGLLHHRGY